MHVHTSNPSGGIKHLKSQPTPSLLPPQPDNGPHTAPWPQHARGGYAGQASVVGASNAFAANPTLPAACRVCPPPLHLHTRPSHRHTRTPACCRDMPVIRTVFEAHAARPFTASEPPPQHLLPGAQAPQAPQPAMRQVHSMPILLGSQHQPQGPRQSDNTSHSASQSKQQQQPSTAASGRPAVAASGPAQARFCPAAPPPSCLPALPAGRPAACSTACWPALLCLCASPPPLAMQAGFGRILQGVARELQSAASAPLPEVGAGSIAEVSLVLPPCSGREGGGWPGIAWLSL
jgi:hypothetical protein